jgi:hypothetical protein
MERRLMATERSGRPDGERVFLGRPNVDEAIEMLVGGERIWISQPDGDEVHGVQMIGCRLHFIIILALLLALLYEFFYI